MPTFSPSLFSFFIFLRFPQPSPSASPSSYLLFFFQIILIHAKILFRDCILCQPMQRSPWSYTPPSLLSFLNVSFISRDTALLFFFLFFLRLSYVPLFPRCSIFPCILASLSSYLCLSIASIPSFFSFVLPLLSCVFNSPRVFYIPLSPPIFRRSSGSNHTFLHLCLPLAYLYGLSSSSFSLSLEISHSSYVYVHIFHILHPFSIQSILVIFTSLA